MQAQGCKQRDAEAVGREMEELGNMGNVSANLKGLENC